MSGKKGTSGKRVHDWVALESEFMIGDWKNVTDFLRAKKITASATTNRQTKGWADIKIQKRRAVYEEVAQEQQDKLKANLEKGYHNLLNVGILSKLSDVAELKKMDTGDIERLWKILRTEHGLPTTIKLVGEDKNNKFTSYAEIMKHIESKKEKDTLDKAR